MAHHSVLKRNSMKISELIKKLQKIQNEHGDIKVYYNGIFYRGDFNDRLFKEGFVFTNGKLIINY